MSLTKIALLLSLVTTGCAVGSDAYTLPTEKDHPAQTFSAELRGPNYMNVETKLEQTEVWANVNLEDATERDRPGAARDVPLEINKPIIEQH